MRSLRPTQASSTCAGSAPVSRVNVARSCAASTGRADRLGEPVERGGGDQADRRAVHDLAGRGGAGQHDVVTRGARSRPPPTGRRSTSTSGRPAPVVDDHRLAGRARRARDGPVRKRRCQLAAGPWRDRPQQRRGSPPCAAPGHGRVDEAEHAVADGAVGGQVDLRPSRVPGALEGGQADPGDVHGPHPPMPGFPPLPTAGPLPSGKCPTTSCRGRRPRPLAEVGGDQARPPGPAKGVPAVACPGPAASGSPRPGGRCAPA